MTVADGNTLIGGGVMSRNSTGNNNTAIGTTAGHFAIAASSDNVYVGYQAGYYNNDTGDNLGTVGRNKNVFIGSLAGGASASADSIFIGYGAGQTETANDRLIIANNTNTLLYGIFDADPANQRFQINGLLKVTQGTPGVGKVLTDSDGTGLATWQTNASGSVNKYAETLSYSPEIPADTPITITHGLGSTDIIVQLWDLSDGSLITAKVDNRTTNSVDVTFEGSSPAGDVRIVIMS